MTDTAITFTLLKSTASRWRWLQGLKLLGILLVCDALVGFVVDVSFQALGLPKAPIDDGMRSVAGVLLRGLITQGSLVIAAVLIMRGDYSAPAAAPAFSRRGSWLLVGGIVVVHVLLIYAHMKMEGARTSTGGGPGVGLNVQLATMVTATVFAPVGEELLFRKALWSRFQAHWGFPVMLIVSNGLWMLMHDRDSTGMAFLLLSAIMYSALRHLSGSVRFTMVAHAIHNSMVFVVAMLVQ